MNPLTRLRSRIDTRLARMRALGIRGLLHIEQDTLIRLLKATVAATVAWELADHIGHPPAALASLAAILVVQVTVRATLARSIQLTVGVTLGLILALVLGNALGTHWWTIGLIVLAGLLVAEVLRLGPIGVQVPVSALLAFALGSQYGLSRIDDTVIGAVVGIVVNSMIAPPSHVGSAARRLRVIGEDLGCLLADIGSWLADPKADRDLAARWLERARDLASDVRDSRETMLRARESVSFNPLTKSTAAHLDQLNEAQRALDHVVTETRTLTRTIIDLLRDELSTGDILVLRLAGVPLAAAGRAVTAFARLQDDPTDLTARSEAEQANESGRTGRAELNTVLGGLTTGPDGLEADHVLLLSSLAVDIERIVDEVDIRSGVHAAAVRLVPGDSDRTEPAAE